MDQCMQYGRPVLAVRVYSDMRSAGIQPSAVTYAFYNKAMLETSWPSHKRRWIVLKIVIIACIRFNKMSRTHQKKSGSFSTPSLHSRLTKDKSDLISYPHEVEEEKTVEEERTDSLHPLKRLHSSGKLCYSSVYHLGGQQQAGNYAVKGGAFYIASKLPEWSREEDERENHTRRWWVGGQSRHSLRSKTSCSPVCDSHEQHWGGVGLRVQLCSCSQCPRCHRLLYDEEVMVCWSEGGGDYTITCPYCRESLVPTLSITISKVSSTYYNTCHDNYVGLYYCAVAVTKEQIRDH